MIKKKLLDALQRINPLLKRYRAPILVLFVGVLLLVFTSTPQNKPQPERDEMDNGTAQVAKGTFDLGEFETKLAESLSQIEGVGRVTLTLTMKSTEESVYAINIRQSQQNADASSYESELSIVSGSGYAQQPVLVKNLYPTFRGALVLCDGAGSDTVKLAITQAISATCGIGADKVSVLKMQG